MSKSTRPLCALSVDLDPVGCYYRIHGLGEPPPSLSELILRRALPRFGELLARHRIPATFFVVGSDVANPGAGRRILGEMARAGHELGNHSFSHPYRFHRLSRPEIAEELRRAHAGIAEAAGEPPVGFRAPGYNLSAAGLQELVAQGYRYDSSVLPAPLYFSAKAAVMAGMWAARRPSGSALGDPRSVSAPTRPYRPSVKAPWRRGQASLVELPITVSPWLRVPVIGTYVVAAPRWVRRRLVDSVLEQPFFNFELHGIDLAGAEADAIPAELVARQPDLRVPLSAKLQALEETLDRLARTFEFVRLRDAAAAVQRGDL